MSDNETARRVAVIGGGIAGLSAVLELQQIAPTAKIQLLEATGRLGGVLASEQHAGFTIEQSADMFTTDPPAATELVKRLGFEQKLITTVKTEDRAYVATPDGIQPIPRGLSLMLPNDTSAVLASPILSDAGKRRFLEEQHIPARTTGTDESLQDFAVRRFGQEFFERLIQPLASGIYTADPRQLSMQATMQRFLDMESEFGSLIGAGKAKSQNRKRDSTTSGARYGLFRAPAEGVGCLVDWMTTDLQNVDCQIGRQALAIQPHGNRWQVKTDQTTLLVDGVVLAVSARAAGKLLQSVDQSLSATLKTISAASSAIVVQAFDQSQIHWQSNTAGQHQPFAGYGIIYPDYLQRPVIASSFSSNKFVGRAPQGKVLVRSFVGGALNSELVELPDPQLAELAVKELRSTVQLSGNADWTRVYRWRNCMPQYTLNHLQRVEQIETLVDNIRGIELAGNSYRGVGIPACIESGTQAARRVWANRIA